MAPTLAVCGDVISLVVGEKADQDDEDLKNKWDGIHTEIEDQQQLVMALEDKHQIQNTLFWPLTSISGETVSKDSRSDEFDDVNDSDEWAEYESEVTRMGRRTVSQARWVTERRVAGTTQSSLPTPHLHIVIELTNS